ncbi:hypothetical protein F9L16_00755 [Agarivorans sp. B2Z047]|uniref:hypothetical protein n=1 Tax=Agarivorans sp. B2Z047 TaxID=2652721 RepID=UPI00128B7B1B|nr:hypothetical protein [Agarivorans sp. B2Z047]MPW27537.1 hypothetical protein [Agarivorans sp. B2Z047]UQN44622.1 hypothetical protein LQZ07_09200 [Agarivorans sp. B2Z047]
MNEDISALNGMMPISDYSQKKGVSEEQLISEIKEGTRVGRKMGDKWFIKVSTEDTVISFENRNSVHRHQADLDKAQKAIKVAGALTTINTIVHCIVMILVIGFSSQLGAIGAISIFFQGLAVMFSWAVFYTLLSIAVTNALTAKHTIILSSKS